MSQPSKEQILASSSGWVASLLNFLPGLGAGYLYQRRWLPYFITAGTASIWFILGIILQGNNEPSQSKQLIGFLGLFLISLISMVESNLAFRKAVKLLKENIEDSKPIKKKGWFN